MLCQQNGCGDATGSKASCERASRGCNKSRHWSHPALLNKSYTVHSPPTPTLPLASQCQAGPPVEAGNRRPRQEGERDREAGAQGQEFTVKSRSMEQPPNISSISHRSRLWKEPKFTKKEAGDWKCGAAE